jgi:serine/threonine-protein kinase ATR
MEDIRKQLCSDTSEGFSAANLVKESIAITRIFRESNLDDEERSAKRRKTLPDSPDDINDGTYHKLLTVLNGSSHETSVLNLSDLHNIVQ